MINSLSAVNKYSVGDILYVIDENVNLLSEPNSNSKVLNKLSKGSLIQTLETKFDKSGDIRLGDDNIKWNSILTGKWIKIKCVEPLKIEIKDRTYY